MNSWNYGNMRLGNSCMAFVVPRIVDVFFKVVNRLQTLRVDDYADYAALFRRGNEKNNNCTFWKLTLIDCKQNQFNSNGAHSNESGPFRIPKVTLLVFRVHCRTLNSNQSKESEYIMKIPLIPKITTGNDNCFGCPNINTDTLHNVILFIDTSTMLDTSKLIF